MKLRKYLQRPTAPPGFAWRLAARLAIAAIVAYQKHLSPRKGFRCAHRALHGGASCSEFVRRAIVQHGVRDAVPLSRLRFSECRAAALQMSSGNSQSCSQRAKRWWRGLWDGCDLSCCVGDGLDAIFDCGPGDGGCVDCTPCG